VRALDRRHPYPYLYPSYLTPTEWISFPSERIQPYLSKVSRPLPGLASEYDLVDVRDHDTGHYHVAEVCANIGSALWVLFVDNYQSGMLAATGLIIVVILHF